MSPMPDAYVRESLTLNKEDNLIEIRCAECTEYGPKVVKGEDFEDAEDAFNQAKRQLGSHYSAKHADEQDHQGGSTSPNTPSNNQGGGPSQQGASQPINPQQPSKGENSANQEQGSSNDYGGEVNERELIYRKGREGLLQLKKERLKDWLQEAGGVGGQTESRILKVFERNESVHSNPYALYNLLEEETTASGSYINTIVDDVFEPERQHEDVLEGTGYTPWYRRSNGGGQFGRQMQGMGGPQGSGMGGQGYAQSAGGGRQQGSRGQGGQHQQGRNDEELSRKEVAQMISQGINVAQEESEENPIRDGLSDATDEALREMASNVGGLAGTANRVFEEALMSYAQDNPEFIIENMDFLQSALGAAQGPEDENSGGQPQQPESTRKVDQALNNIGNQQNQQEPRPQQSRQQREPQTRRPEQTQSKQSQSTQSPPPTEAEVGMDVGPEDSGFEPSVEEQIDSEEQQEPTGEEKPPEPKPTPGQQQARQSQKKRQEFENGEGPTNEQTDGHKDEEEGFDEIFGDMTE